MGKLDKMIQSLEEEAEKVESDLLTAMKPPTPVAKKEPSTVDGHHAEPAAEKSTSSVDNWAARPSHFLY